METRFDDSDEHGPLRAWRNDPVRNRAARALDEAAGKGLEERLKAGVIGISVDDVARTTVVLVDRARFDPGVAAKIAEVIRRHPETKISIREADQSSVDLLAAYKVLSDRETMLELIGPCYAFGLDVRDCRLTLSMPCDDESAVQRLRDRVGAMVKIRCVPRETLDLRRGTEARGEHGLRLRRSTGGLVNSRAGIRDLSGSGEGDAARDGRQDPAGE